MTYVKTDERTDDKENHAEVSSSNVKGCDHYSAADDSEKDRNDNMVAVLKTLAGRPGDSQGDQEGDYRRRSLDKVGGSAGEAKRSNNRREKVLV